jgi:hypothetical protein
MTLIRHVSPVAEFFAVATIWLVPDRGVIARVMLNEPSDTVDEIPLVTRDLLSVTW